MMVQIIINNHQSYSKFLHGVDGKFNYSYYFGCNAKIVCDLIIVFHLGKCFTDQSVHMAGQNLSQIHARESVGQNQNRFD